MSATSETAARDAALDGIRGLAILLVLAIHIFRFQPDTVAWNWLNHLCKSGWLGVDLFFVLSGFLITRILIRSRGQPNYFRNFYIRRTLRIFPAYYLYLLLCLWVLPYFFKLPEVSAGWTSAFIFYIPNLAMAWHGEWSPMRELDHMWSLAIEEQFYLFWPLIVSLIPAERLRNTCLALIGAAWSCKLLLLAMDAWRYAAYILPFTRMDALAAGAWLATFTGPNGKLTAVPVAMRALMLAAGAALVVGFIALRGLNLNSASLIVAATSASAVAFTGVIYLATRGPGWCASTFQNGVLCYFGRYSYGLYLVHRLWNFYAQKPLQDFFSGFLTGNWAVLSAGLCTAALALGSAVVLYHAFEEPILRLKRGFPMPAASRPPSARL